MKDNEGMRPGDENSRGSTEEGPGHVYVIRAGGLVKIGFTRGAPEQRRRDLQNGSPTELTLVGSEPGSLVVEAALHDCLAEHREHGEWFRIEGKVASLVERFAVSASRRAAEAPRPSQQPARAPSTNGIGVTDTKPCEECGEAFLPKRHTARFCSTRCRVAFNRRKR